jgi:hypothetical protein
MTVSMPGRRLVAGAGAVALLVAIGGYTLLAPRIDSSANRSAAAESSLLGYPASPSGSVPATASESATPPGSGFQPIDMFSTPAPESPDPSSSRSSSPTYHVTESPLRVSLVRRPLATQSTPWLKAKAVGRVALVDGRTVLLDASTNPMLMPGTGRPIPDARMLDLSWAASIVEPQAYGYDEKGARYADRSYWALCGPGASTVALYYWQQLTGHPDVTGTAGYFVDPYTAEGVPWPSAGPTIPVSGGRWLGTYWSGTDTVNGFTAHGRGFLMYMAMQTQPPTWSATGIAVWADASGHPYYPTRGAPLEYIQIGLNWEVSGRYPYDWSEAWYGTVYEWDPTLARDLQVAAMLDVGRDGVPVVAGVDTFDLPNWQAGASTPHTTHAVAIVGYDNTADPPTFTDVDTCGRACNPRSGNTNGQAYVIAQSKMADAIRDAVGIGFSW